MPNRTYKKLVVQCLNQALCLVNSEVLQNCHLWIVAKRHSKNMITEKTILHELLKTTFDKSTISQIENNYLKSLKSVTKWKCFSDYSLDNKNKPNDVITFSIFPYITEHYIIEAILKEIVKVDIMRAKIINEDYIKFLKQYPLINFSFIINDRKELFGTTSAERKISLINEYSHIKKMYETWISNEPEKKSYYSGFIKKINSCLDDIRKNKKVNIYIDVLLISFLGAYVSHLIIDKIDKLEVFGWFSDRDRILDVEDSFIIDLFHNNLHNLLREKKFQYAATPAKSTSKIFYDEFIRILDYIAGTLADYNMTDDLVSKNKFNTILTDYMADNVYTNYIFKLFKDDDTYKCAKIDLFKRN